jgi:bifunctional DNase/RNase
MPHVEAASAPPAPTVPDGYVAMRVARVAQLPEGNAVLLATSEGSAVLPIFVGETEALSIDRRLAQQPFERPLTHDLFDAALHELGGAVTHVRVDSIQGGTFIGTVFVRTATRAFSLDARPSDAIALALGAHAPIYVNRVVLEAAGIPIPTEPAPPAPPGTF